jgi:hypothetical protein
MNARIASIALAASLLSLAAAAAEADRPVPLKEQSLPPSVAAALKAKADKGTLALYQYIHRTRMIYGLSILSVVRDDRDAVAVGKTDTQVATR